MRSMSSAYKPIWVLLAVIGGAVAVAIVPKVTQKNERVVWGDALPKAMDAAKVRAKPVLVYVTASWCGPCQEMKHSTLADERVAAVIRDDFEAVKLDLDANRQLAGQLGVEAIPFFAVLGADGKVVRSQVGYMSAEQMLKWLKG